MTFNCFIAFPINIFEISNNSLIRFPIYDISSFRTLRDNAVL